MQTRLIQEAHEWTNIFGAIMRKSESPARTEIKQDSQCDGRGSLRFGVLPTLGGIWLGAWDLEFVSGFELRASDILHTTRGFTTCQGRAFRPLAPLNLRVFSDGHNPIYETGADIVVDWDQAASRSSADPVTKVLSPDIDKTVLEILTTGNVLVGTFEFSGSDGPRTITNA